ncbi:MAG: glycosyltransferase [Actinomycetes bacterium]
MPACTILIPTWDSADTLETTVEWARRQTVRDIEILIVGDGVTPPTREVIERCVAADSRVRFLDLPKGDNRGERNRHFGVLEARSPVVAYLGDDDIILPKHVENLLSLLPGVDFAQTLNGFINANGDLTLWPTDLSERRWLDWHLQDPPRNRVSITGTAHTVEAYKRLEVGWDVAPPGMWTDLFLWRQFFALPDLKAATHPEMTSLQWPSSVLKTMSEEAIAEHRARWLTMLSRPTAHEDLQRLVQEARVRQLIEFDARLMDLQLRVRAQAERAATLASTQDVEELAAGVVALETELERVKGDLALTQRVLSATRDERDAMMRTLSWRITAPLRAVRRLGRR